ncbi:MAG: DUF262 domain-containing protein [Candidatus Heimdallarchaeota archaeon]
MKFKNFHWTVEKIFGMKEKINPRPQYQRGPVWKRPKQQLLIDTIINDFDIPKIYLRHCRPGSAYRYEVADGQQRLKAIWGFLEGGYATGQLYGDGGDLDFKLFSELPQKTQKRINNYKISVAIAYKASNDQVRELFARLQKGDKLTPAELRNSVPSKIGDIIRAMAQTHSYFKNSPFSSARYKTDDLLSHAFAVEIYQGSKDIKAPNLADMYSEFQKRSVKQRVIGEVNKNLKTMNKMQLNYPKCISTKWGFVDIYSVLSINNLLVRPKKLAYRYVKWEQKRKQSLKSPEKLLDTSLKIDKGLYKYIMAFQKEGATVSNLKIRRDELAKWLLH